MRQTWQYVWDGVVHEPLRLLVTIVALVVGAAALAVLPSCSSMPNGIVAVAYCPGGTAGLGCSPTTIQTAWCDAETGAPVVKCVEREVITALGVELPKPEPD